MELRLKPDYEEARKRYEAFWNRDLYGRPPVNLSIPRDNRIEQPKKEHDSYKDRWCDIEWRVETDAIGVCNREYLGDSLPIVWPNMGPEIFSAWCGCPYEFGDTTTWSGPCVFDIEHDYPTAKFDPKHELFGVLDRYTDLLLERARGKFIVGLTDFHPGGDHLAALRDPAQLALDLIDNPDWVRRALADTLEQYSQAYDYFYEKLRKAGMPITCWTPLIHDGRFYVPSNDFSAMISKEMFDDFFLDGIRHECQLYERSIYHLDGPGALRHLDSILEIPELDAVQWVAGAGNGGFERWVALYQRIQKAGKAIEIIGVEPKHLELLFDSLKPEGVFISSVVGVRGRESAERFLTRIERWR